MIIITGDSKYLGYTYIVAHCNHRGVIANSLRIAFIGELSVYEKSIDIIGELSLSKSPL